MIIVFPELNHPKIQTAIDNYNTMASSDPTLPPLTALDAPDLETACDMINVGEAEAMIAGLDYTTRDIILACRDAFPMGSFADSLIDPDDLLGIPISPEPYHTFSGLAVMQHDSKIYLLADMAACKHPTRDQLVEIIQQTYISATSILPENEEPRIALLSFSSFGSGGQDDTIDLMRSVLEEFSGTNLLIDGEMQLDAAINPEIAKAKSSNSLIAGQANVLIVPDLNSGNILYKAFEQVGGFTVAGPILQGFDMLVSDLSRGSSVDDIIWTIQVLARLAQSRVITS